MFFFALFGGLDIFFGANILFGTVYLAVCARYRNSHRAVMDGIGQLLKLAVWMWACTQSAGTFTEGCFLSVSNCLKIYNNGLRCFVSA